MLVGDDGGFSDYVLWRSINYDYSAKIFVIPEKNNKISKVKYRREVEHIKEKSLLQIQIEKNLDIDEVDNFDSVKISELVDDIINKNEGFGVSLYIAKKFIKFKKEFSQELKYKKFLFLNVIIGLSVLSKGGNLVIKIYDMYTHFTISLLFMIYNYFERFTIVKPFSTRPHSSCRYIIAQKMTEYKPKILDYLKELYDRYLELLKGGRDIDFVYPISKVIKDENFTNYIMEINSQITEQRIDNMEEMKKAMENNPPKFDKMDIKKKCLDLWKIPILKYDPRLATSK